MSQAVRTNSLSYSRACIKLVELQLDSSLTINKFIIILTSNARSSPDISFPGFTFLAEKGHENRKRDLEVFLRNRTDRYGNIYALSFCLLRTLAILFCTRSVLPYGVFPFIASSCEGKRQRMRCPSREDASSLFASFPFLVSLSPLHYPGDRADQLGLFSANGLCCARRIV